MEALEDRKTTTLYTRLSQTTKGKMQVTVE
jgi:hypothetical protein